MILHTVNKTGESLSRCLSLASQGDAVLLIEDGVYAAMDNTENRQTWEAIPSNLTCYVLVEDLAARGLSDKMLPQVTPANWTSFVSLTTEYDKVISWG
jgi:tRNA 2-thiouridine synthesizing protein B